MTGRYLLGIVVLTGSMPAHAERQFDIYGGFAATEGTNVAADNPVYIEPDVSRHQSFDLAFDYGVRASAWGFPGDRGPAWLGLAVDVSRLQSESDEVEIDMLPVTALLMIRGELGDAGAGVRTLYGGAGLSFVLYHAQTDFRPVLPGVLEEVSNDFGVDLRFGARWQLSSRSAWFAEYRRASVHINDRYFDLLFPAGTDIDANLDIDRVVVGWSFEF